MPFRTIDDSNYTGGVNKEIPSWALPKGYLADASNMIFDVPGVARQRNGSTALSSPTTTAFSTALGFCYSLDTTAVEELYAMDSSNVSGSKLYRVNQTTGAATQVATCVVGIAGRAVRHFGFLIFSTDNSLVGGSQRFLTAVAGQTVTQAFNNTSAVVVAAGAQQITLTGADVTTNLRAGGIVYLTDFATVFHAARIVSVDTATKFTIWPKPTVGFTAAAASGITASAAIQNYGGKCATSFQNRLLVGNTTDFASTSQSLIADRRFYYSPLPTESGVVLGSAVVYTGAVFLQPTSTPPLNYVDVPSTDPIIAMEPVSDNELLILTSQSIVIFRGTLATQTAASAPGITFDISPMNTNAGCLSDLSVQRTPHGIIWASSEGIMLYTGGGRTPIDLTAGKYHTAWRNLTRGSSFAVHGSAYVRNHYMVSGISGGTTFSLAFNMDNQTWSPLTGAGTDIFRGIQKPSDPSQVFANRWWDQTATGPSQTGGHVVRIDGLFAPDVVGQTKTDSDGSAVAFSLTTRTITDDMQSERILRRVAARYAATHTSFSNLGVSVGSRVDATDSAGTPTVALGNLSNTSVLTITGQSNATPIVITTSGNHGLQSGDEVDIRGVTVNTNANGHWRIVVITATTFSLAGSSGNGATNATGTCHKVTEQELDCSAADIGQGNYLVVASAGTVNKFEWHGMRLGVMEMLRGMGVSPGVAR